jgi:hypothetical protein
MSFISRERNQVLKGSFTLAGKDYEMDITKIYPTITDGRFEVDMEFTGNNRMGSNVDRVSGSGLNLEILPRHYFCRLADFIRIQVETGFMYLKMVVHGQ